MNKVVTVGLGYIGLPTSALIAKNGIKVHGVDLDKEVVKIINEGNVHIVEPDLDIIVKEVIDKKYFTASTELTYSDVFLVVVPTPFKNNYEPDISYVESATRSIIPFLREGNLYIIESTSPVGTTEKMADLIFDKRPELKGKIFVSYCPERVLPGNIMYELLYNDRVIGGIDEDSTMKSIEFYSKFVKGNLHPTNSRTAEMCKLVENSSRDVQIAFANELSIICDKAKINVLELIDLANKHPRVNILKPGCGVGGHCIAVDPYFITNKFPEESKIIALARDINNFKPKWCLKKIESEIEKLKQIDKLKIKIGVFGLSFKPNIDDLRESPALQIAIEISKKNYSSFFFEPNIDEHDVLKISKINNELLESLDLAIILVKHQEFKNLRFSNTTMVLDFTG